VLGKTYSFPSVSEQEIFIISYQLAAAASRYSWDRHSVITGEDFRHSPWCRNYHIQSADDVCSRLRSLPVQPAATTTSTDPVIIYQSLQNVGPGNCLVAPGLLQLTVLRHHQPTTK